MHRVNVSLPPSWAYVRHEIISGRTGLPVTILVYPLHTIFPHQSTGETQNCTFIYNCSVNVSTEEHLLQRRTIHVSNLADNMCMGNEKGVINWYQPPRSTPPSCQNREREEKKKKNTSCLLSDYPTSTWSINSSHFVLLQTKHVFQICPCNSPWDLAVCVCGAMSLQESSSIVNSYSRESLQTKLSDP